MKPIPTKEQLRAELEEQMRRFAEKGGVVQDVPRGLSGRTDNQNPFSQPLEAKPAQARTPVDEAVQALEARKQGRASTGKKKRPRKKLIKDDFGEPLRWVWEED